MLVKVSPKRPRAVDARRKDRQIIVLALRGVPCVTLARSEVPREELESEDRACLPDISHHARTGLACKNRQEPLGASCYAGRRLVGRRTIIDHGHLLGGGVAGDLLREVDACFFLLRRSA